MPQEFLRVSEFFHFAIWINDTNTSFAETHMLPTPIWLIRAGLWCKSHDAGGVLSGFILGHFLFEVSVFSVLEDVATCVVFCVGFGERDDIDAQREDRAGAMSVTFFCFVSVNRNWFALVTN